MIDDTKTSSGSIVSRRSNKLSRNSRRWSANRPSSKRRNVMSSAESPRIAQARRASSSLTFTKASVDNLFGRGECRPSVAMTTRTDAPVASLRIIVAPQPSVSSSGCGASTKHERAAVCDVTSSALDSNSGRPTTANVSQNAGYVRCRRSLRTATAPAIISAYPFVIGKNARRNPLKLRWFSFTQAHLWRELPCSCFRDLQVKHHLVSGYEQIFQHPDGIPSDPGQQQGIAA